MRKNLLALSIAAMVGGLSGAANAAVTLTTTNQLELISAADVVANPNSDQGKALFGTRLSDPDRATLAGSVAARLANGLEVGGVVYGANNALAGSAQKVVNNAAPGGIGGGHILLVPYFSTQGSNASLLNIVNTDLVNGKAVKLRYRGASNSDDLFDITIYLSPGDVWAANVSQENGYSRLFTEDNSCTIPSRADIRAANNGRFMVGRVRGNAPAETREGYIEILNTADIPPVLTGTGVFGIPAVANPLFNAIKHNAQGVADCTTAVMDLQENPLVFNPASPNSPGNRGYFLPSGGLFANWSVVNTATMASFTGEADAVSLRVGAANGLGNLVWYPQTADVVANPNVLTNDPLLRTDPNGVSIVTAQRLDFPDLSTPYIPGLVGPAARLPGLQAAALTNVLAVRSINNEILTGGNATMQTDWVISMPTRRYAAAVNYSGAAPSAVFNSLNTATNPGTDALPSAYFTAANTRLNTDGRLCVDAGNQRGWNREEVTRTTFNISPWPNLQFCGEVSVVTFNRPVGQGVLGAALTNTSIETRFEEGWFSMNTPGATGIGLPVRGFAAVKAGSNAINLGGTWLHRFER